MELSTSWEVKCHSVFRTFYTFYGTSMFITKPVTVAERSKAGTRTVFARSEVAIVASNPTQGMDV
jgi:hypothetical protein